MIAKISILVLVTLACSITLPITFADTTVNIIMEKTTFSYCEKLFYIIEVSEITDDFAIIHIIDEIGKKSSAIPITITSLQNPVPSLIPFEKEIFPLGKYSIDVEYSGSHSTAEFNLIDTNMFCFSRTVKPILANWFAGHISDGFLMDALQKYVDKEIIHIPFEINKDNVYKIDIPDWVKTVGVWWNNGVITDEDFVQIINYLINKKIITSSEIGNSI